MSEPVSCCVTYNHFHRDRDGAIESWGPPILGHHGQVDHAVGNLLVVEGPVDADHLDGEETKFMTQRFYVLIHVEKFGFPKVRVPA